MEIKAFPLRCRFDPHSYLERSSVVMVTVGTGTGTGTAAGAVKGTRNQLLRKVKGESGPLSIVSDRLACSNRRPENLNWRVCLETSDSCCGPYFVRPANPLDGRR